MKKRILSMLLILSMAFSALAFQAHAADAPAVSDNISLNHVRPGSFLAAENDGYTRVEYLGEAAIVVERYDRDFNFLSGQEIPLELPIFGGVYLGEHYNFVICGQFNDGEDDTAEVIRIIRYSKDWERQAAASLCGANTAAPFTAGSVSVAEAGDMLYVRSSHTMYVSDDGRNHQANIQLSVRISDMEITEHRTDVSNEGTGYVSHSFNQFILRDKEDILAADLGDAYPRAVILFRYENSAGTQQLQGYPESVHVLNIAGQIGNNTTGVALGGLEWSDSAYLVTGNSWDQTEGSGSSQRNIFVTVTPRDSFTEEATQVKWLTHYEEGDNVRLCSPYLVKISDGQFMLLWEENDGLRYVLLNGEAEPTSAIYTGSARLSECKPIVSDGRVTWYTANNGAPVFYQIDPANPAIVYSCASVGSGFEDVSSDEYYYEPVRWAVRNGITAGISENRFGPERTCTRGQIATFLWAKAGRPAPTTKTNPFKDVKETDYFYNAVLWAVEHGITSGVSADRFAPNQTCTRAQTVTFLWAANGRHTVDGGASFSDVSASDYYAKAVQWAVANDVTAGVGGGKFGPQRDCTRGQIVTFLYKTKN